MCRDVSYGQVKRQRIPYLCCSSGLEERNWLAHFGSRVRNSKIEFASFQPSEDIKIKFLI